MSDNQDNYLKLIDLEYQKMIDKQAALMEQEQKLKSRKYMASQKFDSLIVSSILVPLHHIAQDGHQNLLPFH